MFRRREPNWIGFQEAQKTIYNLKQEVEIAEKKLLHAKKSLYERTANRESYKSQLLPEEPVPTPTKPKESKWPPHIVKETLPPSHKVARVNSEKSTVHKKILSTSEEEPNLPPFKFPHTEPPGLNSPFIQSSFDNLLTSSLSEDSFRKDKHSSSEGTSSLIACTYKDANKLIRNTKTRVKELATDTSKSSTSLTSGKEDVYKGRKTVCSKKSQFITSGDFGMEWKEVSPTKAFFLQNKFKTENLHKLKDIINKQKKKQELYQLQIEKEFSSEFEQPSLGNFHAVGDHQPLKAVEDEDIAPVPVRKVCTVKSFPVYKGFSAPPKKLPTATRWRKQKTKHTLAKSSNLKNGGVKSPKRIKAVIRCESDFVSASHWRDVEKTKATDDKEESSSKVVENEDSNVYEENLEDKTHENEQNGNEIGSSNNKVDIQSKILENEQNEKEIGSTNIKVDIQSILKESRSSGNEDSEDSLGNETFSYDVKMQSHVPKIDNDQNSLKENKKPIKSKGVKKKAKKQPEQKTPPSPKIRPYDVEKIRKYMKKKKAERRKRHQEEHRKQISEAQKKRESLEKLLEYQKQNIKAVAKIKPLSPIKILQKKDSMGREHENEHESSPSKNESIAKDFAVPKVNSIEEKDSLVPGGGSSKRKQQEEYERKEILTKEHVSSNKSHKKKHENVHIDISIPKFISVSVSPSSKNQTKSAKDLNHLVSSEETPTKKNKIIAKSNKPSAESAVQERNMEELEGKDKIIDIEDVKMVDINESPMCKIPNLLRSSSSVSTPSDLSHITGVSASFFAKMKTTKEPLPERRPKKDKVLRGLVDSINAMTKPLEPLLRTKQWLDKNPLPPRTAKRRIFETTDFSKQQQLPERDTDVHLDVSKPRNSGESSFKEQVSGIGDVSQLYAQILGRKPTLELVQSIEKRPILDEESHDVMIHQNDKTEDEIIEGSIESEEDYILDQDQGNLNVNHCSEASNGSSHFSDLQKANQTPDPFNLINTWKRKPLGITIHDEKVKAKGTYVPSRFTEDDVPFEEIYKPLITLNHTDSEVKHSESIIAETSPDSPSHVMEYSSYTSVPQSEDHSDSRQATSTEPLSKVSNATALNNHSIEASFESASSVLSDASTKKLTKHSLSRKHTSDEKKSLKSITKKTDSTIKEISELQSSKQSLFHKRTKKDNVSEHSQGSVLDVNSNDISDMILSGTINSEYTLEIEKSLQESIHDARSSGMSEVILSGTINSEYSLQIATEESKEEMEEDSRKEVEGTKKETGHERASASGSSISEVISVVENSKGFRSSAEDLQLKHITLSSKHSELSVHSSSGDKSKLTEMVSSENSSENSAKQQSNVSTRQDTKSISTHSSRASKIDMEHSAVLLKNDQLQSIPSIPSGSQNSVTIDFRQPLRLTLSNGESAQASQGLDLHDNQYLHTQVVTRVASEAAAAAATSAVIAVFETQRALLAEKNYLGIINPYGRSSSSKKTQYSSDFESSQAAKSSSHSPPSSAAGSKHSGSVPEFISEGSNNELSSGNGSIKEKILPEHSYRDQIVPLKSSQSSSVKTEENVPSVHSEEIPNKSQKTPQRSKRKISGNLSSPSPASLSDNESISSETLMSSHSNFSHLSESAISDDSFAQLTLDVVQRMTYEEELRARRQLSLLQFQEKTLVENARAKMMWLELLKKKLKDKGAEKKVSAIKRKQKELISRIRQERTQLQCMQEAYRNICEKHHSLLEDKKKLLKEPRSLAIQLLGKDDKQFTSKYPEGKLKDFSKPKSLSSTPTIASDNDIKTMVDEESVSEVPEMLKGLASNSSQESVVETQVSEPIKTSNSSQNKSQRSSPNPTFSPLNAAQSNSNPSLHSNNSLESALQGIKKLEASKRHLTKREQRILQRRKQVESLLQLQMKLDSEEMAVRELEQKVVDHVKLSKKRTKYYISSSGSTNQDGDKRKDSIYESLPPSTEMQSQVSKLSENLPVHISSENDGKASKSTSDESIPTNLSENLNDESIKSEKENVHASSSPHSNSSLPEEIKSGNGESSSIQTVESPENGSQVEEVVPEVPFQVSPSIKDKSSSSEIYSESFESTPSKKSPSVLSSSSPFKNSSPSRSIKKSSGPGIRLPLVPRNIRRHDSSGSDDSYTISQSETASDQSDIEVRIHALAEELKHRKAEAEKLKREQKKKYREQLKEKELSLQKQLEAYNQYIHQTKLELEHQIESAVSPPQTSDVIVKPRIKWPRPEQVIDSRRVRKQTALSPDTFAIEKKSELVSSNSENIEHFVASSSKEKEKVVRKLFPEPAPKTDEETTSKETSEKSIVDSKEISEALSVTNSSEIQEVSEIEQNKSVSSEVSSDIKEVSEGIENSANSSIKQQKVDEVKSSDSDQKLSSIISSLEENKSSLDTADSKSQSQTDTFITESSSSKSLDLNSPHQNEDSIASNKTVSSDDEQSTKIMKESSRDVIQKLDTSHSNDTSHESSSSEDSISEIQSVINSASLEEELDDESSKKSSKCNSSEGCEVLSKAEVIDVESKCEKLMVNVKSEEKDLDTSLDVQSSSVVLAKDEKKLFPLDVEVVNIVNYLSSSLFDDAFHNLCRISSEKDTLRIFLNSEFRKNKVPLKDVPSQTMTKKTAEALAQSLFDAYLKDTFVSLFGVLRQLKSDSGKSVSSLNSSLDSKCDTEVTDFTTLTNAFNNNSMTTIEGTDEFPVNHVTQDINENQIFTKSADWSTDNLIASDPEREQQIQQLEQQLMLQQYSYFYRKIPNKPPPPYTPPSSSSALPFEFPFIKEKPVEKCTTVKEVTKHIDQIMDRSVEILLEGKKQGLVFSEISLPSEDSISHHLELTMPHQSVFIDLVFDLTKEVVLEKFSETEQTPQPWLRPRKLTPKPLIPSSKKVVSNSIQKDIKKALKIYKDPSNADQKKQLMWSSLKLGRKKRDFVDTILISELKEEEPDWVNYDQDEVTVKLQIADSIFNLLINDTVNSIKELQQKVSW